MLWKRLYLSFCLHGGPLFVRLLDHLRMTCFADIRTASLKKGEKKRSTFDRLALCKRAIASVNILGQLQSINEVHPALLSINAKSTARYDLLLQLLHEEHNFPLAVAMYVVAPYDSIFTDYEVCLHQLEQVVQELTAPKKKKKKKQNAATNQFIAKFGGKDSSNFSLHHI